MAPEGLIVDSSNKLYTVVYTHFAVHEQHKKITT